MKKGFVLISIIMVLILLTISITSAFEMNQNNNNIESPLFKIRKDRALGKDIKNIIENFITRFVGDRIFFLPFKSLIDKIINSNEQNAWTDAGTLCTKLDTCYC